MLMDGWMAVELGKDRQPSGRDQTVFFKCVICTGARWRVVQIKAIKNEDLLPF